MRHHCWNNRVPLSLFALMLCCEVILCLGLAAWKRRLFCFPRSSLGCFGFLSRSWLQLANIGVKEMMEEFKRFLAKEPSAPVNDERAWSGVAEGTFGSAMGNEYETEALVVDLDNNWDDLLQEKNRLVQVLQGIKTDRDRLKDELNEFLVQVKYLSFTWQRLPCSLQAGSHPDLFVVACAYRCRGSLLTLMLCLAARGQGS